MLAKIRSLRGATCTVIAALVVLSLVLPVVFVGTSMSARILPNWLTWARSTEALGYHSYNSKHDSGLTNLRSRFDLTRLCKSCPLKVYVYEFPRKFNFGLLQKETTPDQDLPWRDDDHLPTWPMHSGLKKQHNVEYWMMVDLFDNHSENERDRAAVRVKDPEQADLFFVPFFSSLSFNKFGSVMRDPMAEKDRLMQEETVRMLYASKWWQRSGGLDHVVTVHHPNAFRSYRYLLNASIFIVADFGRNPANVSSLEKDVVAPYTHLVPTYENEVQDPFESRNILLYFQGRIKRKDDGIVRTQLAMLLQNKTGVHFEDGVANVEGLKEATLGMRRSRFCLHPAGDTPSSCRLFDAIVSHCVPVIISDKIELPFEDDLNYSSFAIFFSVEEALQPGLLLYKLRNVGKDQWLQLYQKLKEVTPHFEFQHPTKINDAVNMIWKQLHRKVPKINLAMHRKQRMKIAEWWR